MNEFIDTSFGSLADVQYFYSRSDGYFWPIGVADERKLSKIIDDYIENKSDLSKKKLAAREYAERELDFNKNSSILHNIIERTESGNVNGYLKSRIQSYDRVIIHKIMYVFYQFYQIKKKLMG